MITETKTWTRAQTRTGRRAARSLAVIGAVQIGLAVGQTWCIALILGRVIAGVRFAAAAGSPLAAAPMPYSSAAWLPLFGFTIACLLRALLQFAAGTRAAALGADARRRLRTDALSRVLDAGPAILRRRSSGELVGMLVEGIENADGFFSRWLPAASLASIGPAIVLVAVLAADPRAALVLFCAGLSVPVFQAVFGIGAAAASRRQFTALTRLQGRFLDRIRGIGTIVLAGAATHEAQRLDEAARELRIRTMRVLRVAFLSSAALDCAMAVSIVLIAIADRRYFGIGYSGTGAATVAPTAFQAACAIFALLAVPEFFAPLRAFALAYQDRHRIAATADAFVALPPASGTVPTDAPAIRHVEARGVAVAFEDVGFAWDPTRGPVLSGLTFRIPAGETALLIGPSGSGKSTVLEMLLGFIAPGQGRVTINGADLATIVPQALSQFTSWIGQKPVIFAGSIRENIAFARPGASESELEDAVRAARLDGWASSLPRGLDTQVGEGGFGVSGGQAQRIAIARAFLKNAPLLLLDEPTAHLDPATEAEILDSLKRLALGRTVLLASHSGAAHAFSGRRIELGRTTPASEAVPA